MASTNPHYNRLRVLTVQNAIPDNFLNIYTMIITFYFVKQLNAEGKDGN